MNNYCLLSCLIITYNSLIYTSDKRKVTSCMTIIHPWYSSCLIVLNLSSLHMRKILRSTTWARSTRPLTCNNMLTLRPHDRRRITPVYRHVTWLLEGINQCRLLSAMWEMHFEELTEEDDIIQPNFKYMFGKNKMEHFEYKSLILIYAF